MNINCLILNVGDWGGIECNETIGNSNRTSNGTKPKIESSSGANIGLIVALVVVAVAVIAIVSVIIAVFYVRNRRKKVVFKDPRYDTIVFGKYLTLLYEGNYSIVKPLEAVGRRR